VTLLSADALATRVAVSALIGVMAVQASFLVHEAAHGAVSRRPWLVELIGQLGDTVLVGYDFAYFRRSHDLHHFHTNEPATDPDGLSDLFSVNPWSVAQKTGLRRFITRHQGILIPVLYALWAFAMKWDGLTFVVRNRRRLRLDAGMLLVHVAVWLVLPALVMGPGQALSSYLVWNVVAGLYLGVIIPVNHVGMPTVALDDDPDFLTQQVRGSRNLAGPRRLYDWIFIGLNRQIEHHLFPFVPGPRLHLGRDAVRRFCAAQGLPYHETRYLPATQAVYRHLFAMGRLARATPGASADAKVPGIPIRALPDAVSGAVHDRV
jgi:fatty acid desaturase